MASLDHRQSRNVFKTLEQAAKIFGTKSCRIFLCTFCVAPLGEVVLTLAVIAFEGCQPLGQRFA
eukprot:4792993-Karenia_brevis.AAC.1